MRASQFMLATLRESPADAEIMSHQYMLRAGLIRKLATGLYTWLPMGLRVLQKVQAIIREEMNAAGALEISMPVAQPIELWEESERALAYGPELLRFKDRHQRSLVLGPTHEEVVTDLVRQELKSYKQLPVNFYQIQTKFRDEIRPRFGVMRAREFIMKDAYSFHADQASLAQTYQVMYDSYTRIFNRLGLDFRAVHADTGSIGGSASHEFQVLADSGEDAIAISNTSQYAANIELAEAISAGTRNAATQPLMTVATPNASSIEDVSQLLNIDPNQTLKVLIVNAAPVQTDELGSDNSPGLVALVLRGDHTLNEVKAEKLPQLAAPLTFATEEILQAAGLVKGFIGIQGVQALHIPMLVDRAAALVSDAVTGADAAGHHVTGFNWQRDAELNEAAIVDIRNVVEGDLSPDGQGTLTIRRGIEVGHIFQLGTKYSEALKCKVLDQTGKPLTVTMGCYGIGVTRVVAAAIEQRHDDKGIIWPDSIAPFRVVIVPMNQAKSPRAMAAAEELYHELKTLGIDVLLDDRDERPGVKFADLDLIGIPHRIVVSERGLDARTFEYRHRTASDVQNLDKAALMALLH